MHDLGGGALAMQLSFPVHRAFLLASCSSAFGLCFLCLVTWLQLDFCASTSQAVRWNKHFLHQSFVWPRRSSLK